ncbi:MAG: tetratricopeptide repeat protein [Saprospiraceae bacterium]
MKRHLQKLSLAFLLLMFSAFLFAQKVGTARGVVNANPESYGREVLLHLTQAENLMLQGEYEQAIITFDKAIAQAPEFAETYIRRSMALYKQGRFAEAQQDYAMATRLNPYIGDLFGYQNDLRKLRVLAFDPMKFTELPTLSYRMTYYEKSYGETFELDSILEKNPTLDYILQKSIDNIKKGELALALADLNEFKEEESATLYDLKGLIFAEQGDYLRAETYFEQAIEADPSYDLGYLNLSLISMQEGNLKAALKYVDKVIELNPYMNKAYFYRATLYKKMGESEKALKEYDLIEKQSENNSYRLFLNRAIAQKMSGDALSALEDMNKAIALEPTNAALYKLRGNIHILLNNYIEAVQDYDKAIDLDDRFAEAYFNRGIAHVLDNNRTNACADFEKSVTLGYEVGEEQLTYFCSF